ncbi:MAG: peptidoglycan bridge formation glycyltransferase FemA/FemB family protein [Clostridia bacterium]|nr:peptidoglycan bridge formation glycyltransferase FemA/FemB family protein [Clostridia bacterium]
MFEFILNDKTKEYEEFVSAHPNCNFLQASVWSSVKKEWDSVRIVSRDDSGKIRAAMLVLIRKVPHLPYTFLYAPRGPVCDSDEAEGLCDLISGVKALAKEKNAYIFKADPGFEIGDETFIETAKKAGLTFKETGKNFDGIQPRFVFRLNIQDKTEQELFDNFHSKTRYNLRLAERKGVTVRLGDKSDLPRFHEIMQETGERDNFNIRPLSYFEHMYDCMAEENLRLYVAELNGKTIAATIAIYYGDKVWYLYGASSNQHRNVMPNYLLQWHMILWALEKKCRIYDFRGVSGDTSPDNPLYGLYRFKKGFSGDMIEFIGETEIVFKPLIKKAVDLAQKILR